MQFLIKDAPKEHFDQFDYLIQAALWLLGEVRRIRKQNERLAKNINDTESAAKDLAQWTWNKTDEIIDGYREHGDPEIVIAPWYLANRATWPEHYPCWTNGSCSSEVSVAFSDKDMLDYWAPLKIPDAPGEVVEGRPPKELGK